MILHNWIGFTAEIC